jgi:tetratricopeptide (TPR) repeat protein
MGFRFWKRIQVAPGVTLNLTKSGPSLSVGPRGAKVTVGGRGVRASVGLPGTGMYYTTKLGSSASKGSKKKGRGTGRKKQAANPQAQAPTQEHFDSLNATGVEKNLVEGCRELTLGHDAAALDQLRQAAGLADGAFLAGFLALKENLVDEAATRLAAALQHEQDLGKTLAKFQIAPVVELPITEELSAQIGPDTRGLLLALAETYQRQEHWPEAIAALQRLHQLAPDDIVVRLSLAELMLERQAADTESYKAVVGLAQDVSNDSAAHATLLLYKARALRMLGLLDAAEEIVTQTLRRKKGRPPELLAGLLYEQALGLEAKGEAGPARAALEKAFALAPDYEDVAERLGL